MFKNTSYSIATLIGKDYADRAAAASAFFGKVSAEEAVALVNQEIDLYPESFAARNDELVELVGNQVIAPLADDGNDGAPTDSFRKAESKDASPMCGYGCYRLGEDGKIYLIGKSEHYHASLGHSFPGYRLIDICRTLGIPNATHNNTRGYITRTCERRLVAAANGIDYNDTAALDAVIASDKPQVLNRVINLETGSLACEAGIKMMLARFYHLSPELPTPKYQGKTPVFFVMADKAGNSGGNYHGTTILMQTLRGLWPGFRDAGAEKGMWKVVPVMINDIADFEAKIKKYNTGDYKTAGFMHEIVLMNYGGIRLTPEFLKAAYDLCHAYDTPCMVDEIQTGMWCDTLFLFRKWGLNPDFAVVGKGFPGGEYPASRILTTKEYDNLNQFGALVTNGQEELASLSYIITMKFVQDNAEELDRLGSSFRAKLDALCAKYPNTLIAVEGFGHNAALHFHTVEEAAKFTHALHDACIDASAQLYKPDCVPAVLFKPPVTMSDAICDKIIGVVDEVLASF
jgi:acetylornithine/succinyldiaminopimelate/putrescine aminotransferase